MKKKYRDITVNGKKYAWAVSNSNADDGDDSILKIWCNKIVIWQELINQEITPKIVSEIIKNKISKTKVLDPDNRLSQLTKNMIADCN